jgi:hypothetical protein
MAVVAQKIDKNMYQIKGFQATKLGKEYQVQNARRYEKNNPMIRIMDSAIRNFGWGYGDKYKVYITEKKILLEKE